jgi:hypothetical protein
LVVEAKSFATAKLVKSICARTDLTSFAVVKRFDDSPAHSGSMGQETAEICTAQMDLQPAVQSPTGS